VRIQTLLGAVEGASNGGMGGCVRDNLEREASFLIDWEKLERRHLGGR